MIVEKIFEKKQRLGDKNERIKERNLEIANFKRQE